MKVADFFFLDCPQPKEESILPVAFDGRQMN